ncbi:uncharacterized protein [Haliotis asinina]|uniref:uncharacterized protein n=1 Tax=Haliotis asinina TaxID=109174 RepID=UPI0035323427
MSAKKSPKQALSTHDSEEDILSEVKIATSNPFRPAVYATGHFWEKMSKQLENDILLLPEGTGERWNTVMQILLGTSKMGLIYMGTSLPQALDLQLKNTNVEGVAFDACVIASERPVQILTFVTSDSKHKYDSLVQRNDELSKGVLYSLREFTDEKFNIVNGVFDLGVLENGAGFEDKMKTLKEKSCRYVNPRSLEMNPSKCKNLCKAFFVASAVDHTSKQTSSDKIVLLKWKEVINRLSSSGITMLGMKGQKNDTLPCSIDFIGDAVHSEVDVNFEEIFQNDGEPSAGYVPCLEDSGRQQTWNEVQEDSFKHDIRTVFLPVPYMDDVLLS